MSNYAYSYALPGSDKKLAISEHALLRLEQRKVPIEQVVALAARVLTVAPTCRAKWSWKGVTAVLLPTTRHIMLITCWLEGDEDRD